MKIAVVGCRGFGRVHLNALSELRRDRELEVYVFSRTEKYAKECYKEFDAEGYFTSYEKVLNSNVDIVDLVLASSPPWKGRGPPKGFIVPTIDSGLHLSSGGQSSGSENHSHLKGDFHC